MQLAIQYFFVSGKLHYYNSTKSVYLYCCMHLQHGH